MLLTDGDIVAVPPCKMQPVDSMLYECPDHPCVLYCMRCASMFMEPAAAVRRPWAVRHAWGTETVTHVLQFVMVRAAAWQDEETCRQIGSCATGDRGMG